MLTHDIHVIKDELVRQCYIIHVILLYCISSGQNACRDEKYLKHSLHLYTTLYRPSVSDLSMHNSIHVVKHELVRHSYAIDNLIIGSAKALTLHKLPCIHLGNRPQLSPPPA